MRAVRYILLVVLFALVCPVHGQTLDQWREMMRKYQEENRIIDEFIQNTRKERQTTENELKATLVRLDNSRKIVTSLDRQIDEQNRKINRLNMTVGRLEVDQAKLRTEYAEMVRAAYKNYKLNNFLLFLFASDDFNEATKRVYFMRRYNIHREDKAAQIREVTDSLALVIAELNGERAELDKTKQTRTTEISSLRKAEKDQRVAADELKKRTSTLTAEKKAKERQIADAQNKINELVASEARKAQNETLTSAQQEYNAKLTGRFDQNQGKLPYPVRNGVVVERFGTSAGSLKNPNKGVRIAASAGSHVNCVFEGTVTTIFSHLGINNSIIVRHGNYMSVYTNLATVSVKMGDKVSLNQKLGTLPAGGDPDYHYLQFEIWRISTDKKGQPAVNLNPESWLRR